MISTSVAFRFRIRKYVVIFPFPFTSISPLVTISNPLFSRALDEENQMCQVLKTRDKSWTHSKEGGSEVTPTACGDIRVRDPMGKGRGMKDQCNEQGAKGWEWP
jgi:hypothetical protein